MRELGPRWTGHLVRSQGNRKLDVSANMLLRPQLCVWAGHTEVAGEQNPAVLHLKQPRSSVINFKPGPNPGRRLLVGGLSFHGVSGLCMSSLAHMLPGGIQAQGMRRRPMQAWVSCSGSRATACDPHAPRGDQCGEQRGPDIKHRTTLGKPRMVQSFATQPPVGTTTLNADSDHAGCLRTRRSTTGTREARDKGSIDDTDGDRVVKRRVIVLRYRARHSQEHGQRTRS